VKDQGRTASHHAKARPGARGAASAVIWWSRYCAGRAQRN